MVVPHHESWVTKDITTTEEETQNAFISEEVNCGSGGHLTLSCAINALNKVMGHHGAMENVNGHQKMVESMSIKEVDITSEQRGGRNRRRVRLFKCTG